MKFVLLVEGTTERDSAAAFLKRWLDPRLQQRVGFTTVGFKGCANLAGDMTTKARMYLEGPMASDIIAVIGLADLYGPSVYPADKATAVERYDWAKHCFESAVDHPQFRMFFAVHEIEAWLFSQPDIFPAELRKAIAKINKPEQVNFDRPPAKFLDDLYRRELKTSYKKTSYGKGLFAKLDPVIAANKCPYLKAMLDEMLSLAKRRGL